MADLGELSLLYSEPDILTRVFLMLNLKDLLAVEEVCREWRYLGKDRSENISLTEKTVSVIHENIWRKKLKAAESGWRFSLRQHNWQRMSHYEAKQLYLHLSSVTISEFDLSLENDRTCIEHEQYENRRNRTHRIIMQMLPKEDRSFASPETSYTMSKLLVFGQSSFPLLTTRSGAVVMAGAYYGLGRVVVLPHEALLSNTPVMLGSALWVSGRNTIVSGSDHVKELVPRFVMDPRSKAWSQLQDDWVYREVGRDSVPQYPVRWVRRENLLEERPEFYVTEAHYEDNSQALLEYVRRGGGLIVGGHAWWWDCMKRDDSLSCLLHHPGNSFLTEFGLALSPEFEDDRNAKYPINTAKVPSVKQSFYYFAMMRASGKQYKKHDEELYREFYLHMNEMADMDKFEDITRLNKKYLDSLRRC